jgi:heterotetrameric sarcosine oxidase gamma subunit
MMQRESGSVTDVAITLLPASPLHLLEIWSNPKEVGSRFQAATGFSLPKMGRSAGTDALRAIRFEPTAWLIEGDTGAIANVLAEDGALTAIGGGIARIRVSGPGWRTLLMEGGVFDAESPDFAPGCSAATIIDHVNVRLHVVSHDSCDAYVPASFRAGLMHFWQVAAESLL